MVLLLKNRAEGLRWEWGKGMAGQSQIYSPGVVHTTSYDPKDRRTDDPTGTEQQTLRVCSQEQSRWNSQRHKGHGMEISHGFPASKRVPRGPWHEQQRQSGPNRHAEWIQNTYLRWHPERVWQVGCTMAQNTEYPASGHSQPLDDSSLLEKQLQRAWEQNWKCLLGKPSRVSTKENVHLSVVCQLASGSPPLCPGIIFCVATHSHHCNSPTAMRPYRGRGVAFPFKGAPTKIRWERTFAWME